jgi:hypothetical protein
MKKKPSVGMLERLIGQVCSSTAETTDCVPKTVAVFLLKARAKSDRAVSKWDTAASINGRCESVWYLNRKRNFRGKLNSRMYMKFHKMHFDEYSRILY